MRKFLRFGFVLLFVFLGFDGIGQRKCGTESPTFDQTQIMLKSITDFEKNILPNRKQSRIQSISVPVKFHALYDGFGNGGNLNSSIPNIINRLNFWYANSGISFYPLVGINTISSYEYYYCNLDNTYDDRKALMDNYGYTNALNIFLIGHFITTNPSDDVSRVTGIAYFPLPSTYKTTDDITNLYSSKSSNGLFILSDFTYFTDKTYSQNINYQIESTIPHEIGHYWGLLHTFSTSAGAEYVNGTNGSTIGDLVQDTPADNKLLDSFLMKNLSGNCYLASNSVRDPNNQQYFPQLDNMMSYYDDCGGRITGGQATRTLWGQYVRNRLNPDLSQRYYLDGVSRTILRYTGSILLCAGNTVNLTLNSYGDPSYCQGNFYVQIKPINDYLYSAYISSGVNTSTGEVNITGTIPSNTASGYYKIRICKATLATLSDYQEQTIYVNGTTNGIPTGSPIASQYATATTTLNNTTSTCAGNNIGIYGDVSGYDSYWWTKDGLNYTASSTSNYLNATSTGNYTLNMMKCGNVYRSSNSIYLTFYDPTIPSITASSNGVSTNSKLITCEGSPVTLSTGCQSGMNPLWNDGSTSSIRYFTASSTRDFAVNCSNSFCNAGYSPTMRIVTLNANTQSTKNGNWQDITLWTSNITPLNCQTVTIQTGHTVTVPINDAKAKNIIIRGNLNFLNVSPTVKAKVGLGI
jgi:hypothetical protein